MTHGDGFLLVYSVVQMSSFQEVGHYRDKILRIKESDVWPLVLVGNKADLAEEREVQPSEGKALADSWAIPFSETSAKTRMNVDHIFAELVREVRKKTGFNPNSQSGGGSVAVIGRRICSLF